MDKLPAFLHWRRWAIVLVAAVVYRNFRLFSQIVNPPTLPSSFSSVGNCTAIHHPVHKVDFCEDFVEWKFVGGEDGAVKGKQDSRLVLSCDPGRKEWNTLMGPLRKPDPRGDLWIFNPHDSLEPEIPKRVVLEGFPAKADFHPFGIQVIQPAHGKESYLYVINQRREHPAIEFFTLPFPKAGEETIRARHVKTLRHPAFVSPNSLAMLNPSTFYVTNDHRMTPRLPFIFGQLLSMVESVFALPLGWVDRVDLDLSGWEVSGDPNQITFKVTRAISNVPFANGAAVSQDGRELAVASSTTLEVRFYDIQETGLTPQNTVQVPFHPDNLRYGTGRTLVVAGHPSFLPLLMVAKGLLKRETPSWVVRLTPTPRAKVGDSGKNAVNPSNPRSSHEITTLYQSDGRLGYASSSTAVYVEDEKKLFITGLFEAGMLRCGP